MYCQNCGSRVLDSDLFCSDCGSRIFKDNSSPNPAPAVNRPISAYSYQAPLANMPYTTSPGKFRAYTPAPLLPRIGAYIIDYGIVSLVGVVCPLTFLYFLFKDGMNEGKSIGKGIMGLRVVKYDTGLPAGYPDSCVRNCCDCCVCWLFCDRERRHIGDFIANTIVIQDS